MVMRPLVTLYTCFCEFEDGQWSFCCDLTDFDGACDSYIEARDQGAAAGVWSLNLTTNEMRDVTADAEKRIAQWLLATRRDLPEWMDR